MNLHTDIATSVVRSVEPERTQQVNQRTAGLAQDELAAETVVQSGRKKVDASKKADKSKIKKEGDRRKDTHTQEDSHRGQAYSPGGQTESIGEDSEGHVIDALA